jgi:hypothetical protein
MMSFEGFSDILDTTIIQAEKSIKLLIICYIIFSPFIFLGNTTLAILPPVIASLFFGASSLYYVAEIVLEDSSKTNGKIAGFIPLFASVSFLLNLVMNYALIIIAIYTVICLTIILLLKTYSDKREFLVLMAYPK